MTQFDVPVPETCELSAVTEVITAAIDAAGLTITLKTTLATYPGSLHWHLKQGAQPGTLEITWQPSQRRLWLSVQSRRDAPWIASAVADLKIALAARLTLSPDNI